MGVGMVVVGDRVVAGDTAAVGRGMEVARGMGEAKEGTVEVVGTNATTGVVGTVVAGHPPRGFAMIERRRGSWRTLPSKAHGSSSPMSPSSDLVSPFLQYQVAVGRVRHWAQHLTPHSVRR